MVRKSPIASWTRGASKTPTGATGATPWSTLVRFRFVRGPHADGAGVEETAMEVMHNGLPAWTCIRRRWWPACGW